MLVLTRRAGESVFIGEGIEITVQSVKGENVRLAISAPKEIPILRSELKEAREVNRQSSAAPAAAISALRAGIKTEKSAADL